MEPEPSSSPPVVARLLAADRWFSNYRRVEEGEGWELGKLKRYSITASTVIQPFSKHIFTDCLC